MSHLIIDSDQKPINQAYMRLCSDGESRAVRGNQREKNFYQMLC